MVSAINDYLKGNIRSQRGLIALPLLLQLRQEGDESLIFPQTIQVGIALEQWITGKAIVGGDLQPFNCRLRFVEQRISRSDVISGVMKMAETFPDLDGALDRLFRLHARDQLWLAALP